MSDPSEWETGQMFSIKLLAAALGRRGADISEDEILFRGRLDSSAVRISAQGDQLFVHVLPDDGVPRELSLHLRDIADAVAKISE